MEHIIGTNKANVGSIIGVFSGKIVILLGLGHAFYNENKNEEN